MAASSLRRNDLLVKALGLVFAVLWGLKVQLFFSVIVIIVIQ